MSEQLPPINPNVEKAKRDVVRLTESKKGLLKDFDPPDTEERDEKYFSKETLLAGIYQKEVDLFEEVLSNGFAVKRAFEDAECEAYKIVEDGNRLKSYNANFTFKTFYALYVLNPAILTPEESKKIVAYLMNPNFVNVAVEDEIRGLEKSAGMDKRVMAMWGLQFFSMIRCLHPPFSPQNKQEIDKYLSSRTFIEKAFAGIKKRVNTTVSDDVLETLSAFCFMNFALLKPEEKEEILSYIMDPTIMRGAVDVIKANIEKGTIESANAEFAASSVQGIFAIKTIVNYLREKGKRIEDERSAEEALNPKKKIQPRPETRRF